MNTVPDSRPTATDLPGTGGDWPPSGPMPTTRISDDSVGGGLPRGDPQVVRGDGGAQGADAAGAGLGQHAPDCQLEPLSEPA